MSSECCFENINSTKKKRMNCLQYTNKNVISRMKQKTTTWRSNSSAVLRGSIKRVRRISLPRTPRVMCDCFFVSVVHDAYACSLRRLFVFSHRDVWCVFFSSFFFLTVHFSFVSFRCDCYFYIRFRFRFRFVYNFLVSCVCL